MRNKIVSLVMASMLLPAALIAQDKSDAELKSAFVSPKDVITSCYWYWISGNVSKQGVINDVKSMKQAGINRAFIGWQGLDANEAPRGPVYCQTPEWYDIMHAALKTATEEGIEIGIFNGPGWSQAGGPWVKPEQSMRYLASQTQTVKGGKTRTIEFAHPDNFLENVKVLAYRAKGAFATITGSVDQVSAQGVDGVANAFDANPATMAEVKKGKSSISIKPTKKGFTLRSISIFVDNTASSNISVKALKDGKWDEVRSFVLNRTNLGIEVGYDMKAPVTFSIPEVAAQEFRIDIESAKDFRAKEITMSEEPVVEQYSEKILAKMHQTPQPYWHDYKWSTNVSYDKKGIPSAAEVIDITKHLDGDRLTYKFPKGDWKVVRMYMAPTNICNAPALDGDGRGLEVDRWNQEALQHHYDSYIGDIMRHVPAEDRKTWKVIVCDSYEKATQNYGDDFVEYFTKHFGYDPTPYLLTFSGQVVESSEKSDRFLWDLRRMIADRLAYDHIGALSKIAHKDGFHMWLESYGHWGYPGEFLQYGGQSDEVGGEFWSEGSLGDIENRAASSAAHIYGKRLVSAESFTCGGPEYCRSPRDMKKRGDKFFTEGINNTLLHLYVSQPDETSIPGFNCPFGNEFNRKNTWYSQLYQFTDYVKRCNMMLQQGNYVADVAYFIGEDVPVMTGITEPALPKGYQYDYINAEVIEQNLKAGADHSLTLPHGSKYRLLVLPPTDKMRPEVLKKIKQLILDGAVVLGPKPSQSPSLQNYPMADAEVKAIADELWGTDNSARRMRRIGKGILFSGYQIDEIFDVIGNRPDCAIYGADGVLYSHVSIPGRDIYFVANQNDTKVEINAVFRVAGRMPELWNAIDGSTRDARSFAIANGTTTVPLRLEGNESVFIVFKRPVDGNGTDINIVANYPERTELANIAEGWNIDFATMFGETKSVASSALFDWTTSADDFIKYFSGTAVYTNKFNLAAVDKSSRIILDLGTMTEMARVKVNGKQVGGAWTAPYDVDITDAVVAGDNTIEIEVVNNWQNRIIGDARLPESQRKTNLKVRTFKADSKLQPSGLVGPVKILNEK